MQWNKGIVADYIATQIGQCNKIVADYIATQTGQCNKIVVDIIMHIQQDCKVLEKEKIALVSTAPLLIWIVRWTALHREAIIIKQIEFSQRVALGLPLKSQTML